MATSDAPDLSDLLACPTRLTCPAYTAGETDVM